MNKNEKAEKPTIPEMIRTLQEVMDKVVQDRASEFRIHIDNIIINGGDDGKVVSAGPYTSMMGELLKTGTEPGYDILEEAVKNGVAVDMSRGLTPEELEIHRPSLEKHGLTPFTPENTQKMRDERFMAALPPTNGQYRNGHGQWVEKPPETDNMWAGKEPKENIPDITIAVLEREKALNKVEDPGDANRGIFFSIPQIPGRTFLYRPDMDDFQMDYMDNSEFTPVDKNFLPVVREEFNLHLKRLNRVWVHLNKVRR